MAHIRRRRFLTAAGALLAAPNLALAQRRIPLLGTLTPAPRPAPEVLADIVKKSAFYARLRELGWIEGKTLHVERAFSGSTLDRLPEAAVELVAKKPDVIFTGSPLGAVAAARATKTIPIVFWRVGFAVESGLIHSFAKPGGNVTGLAWFADESIYVKRIQLLRELAPDARSLAALSTTGSAPKVSGGMVDLAPFRAKIDAAAKEFGFQFRRFNVERESEIDPALAAIAEWRPDAFIAPDVPLILSARKRIIDFSRRHRLIDIYETREWTEAGGLASYGIVFLPTLLRTAEMVDRILRGAKPADIPVELPSHHELILNARVARSQEFKIPQSILARADQVLE